LLFRRPARLNPVAEKQRCSLENSLLNWFVGPGSGGHETNA
jgi:hypothetical protein